MLSTLPVMVGLTVVGIVIITIAPFESKITTNLLTATQAFYVAEAGMNRLLGKYRSDSSLFTGTSTVTAMGLDAAKPGTANFGATFAYWFPSLTYEASAPPQYVDLESHGSVVGTNTLAKIAARIAYSPKSLFNYGIFGDTSVNVGDVVDSYNSCDAPYDPGNPGDNGDVGTNGIGCSPQDCMIVGSSAVIQGNAIVGHGGDPALDIDNKGTITGSQSALTAPGDMTPEADPGGGTADTLDLTGSDTKTFTSGTYRLPYVRVQSSAIATIDGDVTLYVDGRFDIGGSGQLKINPGGSLTIYVSDNVDIGGGGVVNLTDSPTNLTLYGTSTSTYIKLHGNSDFQGAVYAPNALIEVSGTSDLYGSIVGGRVVSTSRVHYDECLNDGLNGDSEFRIVLWRID